MSYFALTLLELYVNSVAGNLGPSRASPEGSCRKASRPSKAVYVVERQVRWRELRGSFQLPIPVSSKDELVQPEEQQYSMLLAIQQHISANDRWFAVFNRCGADRLDSWRTRRQSRIHFAVANERSAATEEASPRRA